MQNLDAKVIKRLTLKPVTFELEHQIEFPGESIRYLYFVEEGMASLTTTFENGAQVEVGMFGYESVIGFQPSWGRSEVSIGYTPKLQDTVTRVHSKPQEVSFDAAEPSNR
ncbi:hypothetical protein [Tunturiibacter psychrotolerans]|uniref:hypothetical protein n=1 Tax=Tunturiibacter psychrotolerans TaxID=3069686 RepID=UPI003D1A74D1